MSKFLFKFLLEQAKILGMGLLIFLIPVLVLLALIWILYTFGPVSGLVLSALGLVYIMYVTGREALYERRRKETQRKREAKTLDLVSKDHGN